MTPKRASYSDKASVWIAGLIFVVPLLFLTSIYDTYDLPKLVLVQLVDLALLVLWIQTALTENTVYWRRSALDWPVLAFLAAGMISTLHSVDPPLSLWGSYRVYIFGWVPMFSFALLYWLTIQAASPILVRRVYWAAIVSGALVGVYAGMQYWGLEIFPEIPSAEGARVWSSLGNPVYVGALCMMALPLVMSRWSFGSGIAFFLILGGLLISLSRSAWVGTGVAVAWIVWTKRRDANWNWPRVGGVTFLALVMTIGGSGVRERAKSILSRQDSSNASRIEGWKGGLHVWKAHPILGTGPDTFFQAFRPYRSREYIRVTGPSVTQGHAHNEVIQVGATQGVLGFLCYLWVLVALFRHLLGTSSREKEMLGFGAALLALWVQNQFNFSAVSTSAWAAVFAGIVFSSDQQTISIPVRMPLRPGQVLLACFGGFALWAILIPLRADWHYKQGQIISKQGQSPTALREFREAVRLNGRIEVYESDEANAARSAALWDEAWASAQSMVRRHPQNPDAWNNLGVAAMWLTQLAGRDHWEDARGAFQQAIALDPVFVDAWANLAKYQHLKGNLDEEKKVWQHVLELDPQHEMARQVLKVS